MMFGDRSGVQHTALQMLLLLVHAGTFDAAAKQKADKIGGTFQQLMHRTQGTGIYLALNLQRPRLDQPLIMQSNLLSGQVRLSQCWEVNVKEDKG